MPWSLISDPRHLAPFKRRRASATLNSQQDCYANRTAQGLWGLTWDEFIRLPSRLSAEPLVQAERDRLLARVRAHGFIDDYQGVRIARDGTRFRISGAVVWMVVVEGEKAHGQAALFRE